MRLHVFRCLKWTQILCMLLPALAAFAANVSQAQVAREELHPFQSLTLTDQEFLTGRKDGRPVTVAGELRIPRFGTERLPAIVLLHGSGGVTGSMAEWAQEFNAMGIATFVLDSFTGRGIESTTNDQTQLGRLAMIIDAYRALTLLAKHPRIDGVRIGIMGFSRGGQAALYSSLKRFQRLHGPGSGLEFAAYLVFYPSCVTTYHNDEDVAEKPIRIFHGSADNFNPVTPCRAYVERLRHAGKDVQLFEYPGAHHVFDAPSLKEPLKLPQAQTTRRCQLEETQEGRIVNSQTKALFTYDDPCVEHGTTLAFDERAYSEAKQTIREFVISVFQPKGRT
jgi:dienelactone hydrolase